MKLAVWIIMGVLLAGCGHKTDLKLPDQLPEQNEKPPVTGGRV